MNWLPEGKDWIDFLAAIVPLVLVALALVFTYLNYRLSRARRQDDLFDRRYEFYRRFVRYWLDTGDGSNGAQSPADIHELIPFAEEADFLFGSEVSQMIVSLENKTHEGSPWFVDEYVSGPFGRYLRLGR